MLRDDLRAIYYILRKDLDTYYFKPPNISWGIFFPLAFILAFSIRNPGNMRELMPGLVAMTMLFGTTAMEAIVIVLERRTGSLERLLLAPVSLPAMLAGKVLGGMCFGTVMSLLVLAGTAVFLGTGGTNWVTVAGTLLLSAAAFSSLGALVSVTVKEVFEAQTLANYLRFPMIFLGGVFVPLTDLPQGLRVIAGLLPLTYSVEAMRLGMAGEPAGAAMPDLLILAVWTIMSYGLAWRALRRRLA